MKSNEFITQYMHEDLLDESIEDKGIFKACFLSGLPGAGKSTVLSKVSDGTVEPRIVNTDRTYEFLLKKHGMEATGAAWNLLGPLSKTLNASSLYHYLNGMLPLFVDGTSADTGSLLRRSGILESLGYDTMMVWVDVNLDEAIKRAQARERKVDPSFIKHLHKQMANNKEFYKSRFGNNFIEVNNNADNFSAMEIKTYNIANRFFNSPVQNPYGNKTIDKLKEANEKYLVPTIYDSEYLKKMVSVWYQK